MLFMFTIYGLPTYGANVCAKTGTYIGVLKKDVNGTVSATDMTTKSWKILFDYDGDNVNEKMITGLASCNGITGTFGIPVTNLYTDASDVGTYCWCKMEPVITYYTAENKRPTGITSYWTFLQTFNSETDCASDCTSECADAVANNTSDFRYKLFEAIW